MKIVKKMTIFLDNLPNEVLLKVFTYLNIRDLGYCAQVSKRLGDISIDESLWQKINVFNKVVPTGFIQHILKVRKSQKIFVLLSKRYRLNQSSKLHNAICFESLK